MQNGETTDETEVEQKDGQVETQETPVETQEETTESQPIDELAKAKAEAAKYRRLFEKAQKAPAVAEPQSQTSSSSANVEETVLRANGMKPELLKELKAIATLRNVSLIDAQTDPLFVAMKSQFEKKEKHDAASIGASRGSGSAAVRKSVTTPGLTREEHMALVRGK